MAQPIYCDADGCTDQADVLISSVGTGDVQAFCGSHFTVFCASVGIRSGLVVDAQSVQQPAPPENAPEEAPARRRRRRDQVDEPGEAHEGQEPEQPQE